MPAICQIGLKNNPEKAAETQERARIAKEREELQSHLAQQRQACYQKFAVTPCINEARDAHNEKMSDLKRQEAALDDAVRKRAAANRLKNIDERNSPQAQLKQAQNRGRALERSAERAQAQQNKKQKQEERVAKAAASAASAASTPVTSPGTTPTAALPTGKARPPVQEKLPPGQRPGDGQKIELAQKEAVAREKAAADRRAKQQQTEAKRKKPPSASLPIPPG